MEQNTTQNVPDVIRQEAKTKALAVLNSEPGCISMIRPEDLETAALFIPVVTIIKPVREDFYDPIPKIGIMAKPMLMNTIREKAGVEILRTETSKRGEHIWVGHAYGQKRMPDGTMFPDDAGYEFNADERAEADILGSPDKYKNDTQKRLHVLEVAKFGEQRAVTGAQHALICKMAKVARSFRTLEELMRGMKVLRIDRNVNGIMQDPSMRREIIDHALGVTKEIYGPEKALPAAPVARTYDDDGERVEQPAAEEGQLGFPELDAPAAEKPAEPEKTPEQKAKDTLASYKERIPASVKQNGVGIHDRIDGQVKNEKATLATLNLAIDWCESWLQSHPQQKAG